MPQTSFHIIDFVILIVFMFTILVIGLKNRKHTDINFGSYAFGINTSPSTLMMICSFFSASFAGSEIVGILQVTYSQGITFYLVAISLGIISEIIVPFFFIKRLRDKKLDYETEYPNYTLYEWMDKKYNFPNIRALMSLSEVMLTIGVIVLQYKCIGIVLKTAFDLDENMTTVLICVFAGISILYSSIGGIKSIAYTDALFAGIFLLSMIFVLGYIIFDHNDLSQGMNIVMSHPNIKMKQSIAESSSTIFFLACWLKNLTPYVQGHNYQRMVLCEDEQKTKKSFIYSLILRITLIVVLMFIAALIYSKDQTLQPGSIFPYFLSKYCPVVIKGLIVSGTLSMAISVANARLNVATVMFTNDVLPQISKLFKGNYKADLFGAKLSSLVIGFVCLYQSLQPGALLDVFMGFSNFYTPVVAVPSILTMFGCMLKKNSIIVGIACGITATLGYYLQTGNLGSFFVGVFANLGGVLIMEAYYKWVKPVISKA